MSTELHKILDASVPPVPAALDRAPLAAIRRRARRTRVVGASLAGLAALVLVAGTVAGVRVVLGRSTVVNDPAVTVSPTPEPSTVPVPLAAVPTITARGPAAQPGTVLVALVGRDDRDLTLLVNGDGPNGRAYRQATVRAQETPESVVIVVTPGAPTTVSTPPGVQVPVRLAQPLGSRVLRASTGALIRPFFDADLPVLPSGWVSEPQVWWAQDGSGWNYVFVGPHGERVLLSAMLLRPDRYVGVAEVELGTRHAVLLGAPPTAPPTWQLVWTVRDLYYLLSVSGDPGSDDPRQHLLDVVGQLSWL